MRWLMIGVAALFVLWSGYWVVGSRAVLTGVRDFVATAPARGIDLTTGEITLAGYPNRFDLTVDTPAFADAVTGWRWTAPFVQVLALSYTPWHVILALPNAQTVSRAGQTIGVTSERLRASVRVVPDTRLALDEVVVEGDALALASDLGWSVKAARTVVALRRDAAGPAAYEFGLRVGEVTPDPALTAALAGVSDLPPVMDSATADILLQLTAPLDRNAQAARPELVSVDIRSVLLTWGPLSIHADGKLAPDDQGRAAGRIEIGVTGWQHLVPLLVAAGVVKPEISQTAENMFRALAEASPDPQVLSLPLTLEDGWATLGPFPLGPAPMLRATPGL